MHPTEISVNLIECFDSDNIGVLYSGGKESSVLWHLVHSIHPNAIPVFIEHGMHPKETHELLHEMYGKGNFPIAFSRNDNALLAIHDGVIDTSMLNEDNVKEAKKLTDSKIIPFNFNEPACKKLLFDIPLDSAMNSFKLIFSGERIDRKPYTPFVHNNIVHPLLTWNEADIWSYIKSLELPYNKLYEKGYRVIDSANDPPPVLLQPAWEQLSSKISENPHDAQFINTISKSVIGVIAEKAAAMAEPSRSEFIDKEIENTDIKAENVHDEVQRILTTMKGGSKFGYTNA